MTNKKIMEEVEELNACLIEIRRDIHAHPEHGFKEVRTSKKIINMLSAYSNIELETGLVRGTGVIATIKGMQPGPTIMLRVDIDCVLAQDKKDVPYQIGRASCRERV